MVALANSGAVARRWLMLIAPCDILADFVRSYALGVYTHISNQEWFRNITVYNESRGSSDENTDAREMLLLIAAIGCTKH